MGFPLIQQPAPLMQLAQTIAAIRERRDARLQAQEERRLAVARDERAERYVQLQAAAQANTAQQQKVANELAQAQLNMDTQREQRAQRTADLLYKRQRMLEAVDLPDEFRASPQLRSQIVNAQQGKTLQGAPDTPRDVPDVGLLASQAAADADLNPGGIPRPGTAGGLTYFPRPQAATFAQERTTGAERVTTQDRLMRAAITGAYQQMQEMERMEAADPSVARTPGVFNTIEQAGNIPLVGGALRGALEPTAQQALTPGQRSYRGMRREFIHTYASSLPGRRLGPELLRLLEVAFFEQAGNTDPAVTAMFRERRREAATRMYRAAQGQDVDLESVLPVDVRTRLNALPADAGTADPTAPPAPRINPRFLQ